MTKLILDYSKWRCGDYGDNKVGKGDTQLLNKQGYMCCLGQFSLQMEPSLKKKDIRDVGEPGDVCSRDGLFSLQENGFSTVLSKEAMDINDNRESTPQEKIAKLKELFWNHGYEIKVINLPKKIKNEYRYR